MRVRDEEMKGWFSVLLAGLWADVGIVSAGVSTWRGLMSVAITPVEDAPR